MLPVVEIYTALDFTNPRISKPGSQYKLPPQVTEWTHDNQPILSRNSISFLKMKCRCDLKYLFFTY